MPAMANLTVKAANGTTDVTLVQLKPASGDNDPAVWREDAATGTPGQKPTLSMTTKSNGPKTGRRSDVSYKGHQVVTDSTTGLTSVENTFVLNASALVPVNMPTAVTTEHIARACNAMATALIKQAIADGYAPS